MEDQGSVWIKRGCLGCGLLVVLAVVASGALWMVFVSRAGEEPRPEHVESAHPLPSVPEPAPPDGSALPGVALPAAGRPEPLRVDLDIVASEVEVEPGPAGEPIRLEATYDTRRFDLEETFDAASGRYRVRFRNRRPLFFVGRVESGSNHLRLVVPRDHPVAIDGRIRMGESRLELGGLWVTDVDLRLGAGEHRLSFAEPLREPLGRFDLQSGVGEVEIRRLGNASPAEAEIHQGVGELTADLSGAWRRDARVEVKLGIGECRVRAPDEAALRVVDSDIGLGQKSIRAASSRTPVPGEPTVELTVSGGIGEVQVER